MFNLEGFGAINFTIPNYEGFENMKIYQELTHAVILGITKHSLDDMPQTIWTLCTQVEQLNKLLRDWDWYEENEVEEHLLGTRIEITIGGVKMVQEAHQRCLNRDLLTIQGIQRLLGGSFEIRSIPIQDVLTNPWSKVWAFKRQVQGANESKPSIRMRTTLTEARQALGWSGKNMPDHLIEAKNWIRAANADQGKRKLPQFQYNGWVQDMEHLRPIIQDFIDNAYWQNYAHQLRNLNLKPIFLQKSRGSRYFQTKYVYADRVGGACHFVRQFGVNWRRHINLVAV